MANLRCSHSCLLCRDTCAGDEQSDLAATDSLRRASSCHWPAMAPSDAHAASHASALPAEILRGTERQPWPVLCLKCLCTACREALHGDKSTRPVDVTFLTRWARLDSEDEAATAVGYPAVAYAPAPIWTRPSPVS